MIQIQTDGALESIAIPRAGKERSSELVSNANRMWKVLSRSNLHWIARLYRDAIDVDPGNAEAYAGLSKALMIQGLFGNLYLPTAYASAKAALAEALEIEPELPAAKCAAAWLDMIFTRDWDRARRVFDEILNGSVFDNHSLVGRALLYIAEGANGDASRLLSRAVGQYSLSTPALALYCWNEYLSGDCANAIHQIGQARSRGNFDPIFDAVEALACIQLDDRDMHIKLIEEHAAELPDNDVLRGVLGYVYAKGGQEQRARKIYDGMTHRAVAEKNEAHYAQALVLIGLNESKEAVHCLEMSYREGSLWSLGFRSDPILASLGGNMDYRQFMSKVSYPGSESAVSQTSFAR